MRDSARYYADLLIQDNPFLQYWCQIVETSSDIYGDWNIVKDLFILAQEVLNECD